MTVLKSVQEFINDDQARTRAYSQIAQTSQEICESMKAALDAPEDLSYDGWEIKRVFIPIFEMEMRLCESTRAGVVYTLPPDRAEDVTIVVRRGVLHVEYDDASVGMDITPGRMVFLPAHIQRTVFAAEHPTTLFALLYGRPETRERNYTDLIQPGC